MPNTQITLNVPCDLRDEVGRLTRLLVMKAMTETEGNIAEAARLVGLDAKTMYRHVVEAERIWGVQ